ncbi:MAG: DUF5711 family protein [Bacillota bacterium]
MSSNHKGKKIALLAILVVIIAIGLIYLNNKYINKSISTAFRGSSMTQIGEANAAKTDGSMIYCKDELLIEAEGAVVRARNVKGEQAWSLNLGGKIRNISSSGSNIFVVDTLNKLSCITKQGKVQWTYTCGGEPWNLFTDENGCILIEYKSSSGSKLDVLDGKGIKLGSAVLENAYVISFTASRDKHYTISALDVSSDSIKSRLISYSFGGEMVWAKDYENIIIPYVKYMKGNQLIAAAERELFKFNADGSQSDEIKLEGKILNVSADDNLMAVVLDEKGKLFCATFNSSLRQLSHNELDIEPEGIYANKNVYILYDKDELLIHNEKGMNIASHKSVSDISSAYITGDGKVYIVSGRKLQAFEY